MAKYSVVIKSGCQSPLVNVFDDFYTACEDFFAQIWIYTFAGSVCLFKDTAVENSDDFGSCVYDFLTEFNGVKTNVKLYTHE